jgi:hypothetical protein
MQISLHQITEEVMSELDSAFDPDTGEALPAFEEKRAMWANKSQHVAAYILNLEAGAKALAEAENRIAIRRKQAESRSAWLRKYLGENMARLGISKIESDDLSFQVIRYPERDESVELDEGATFPPELCGEPKPPGPSKTKIKAAILAGQAIAGARIVKRDRIAIK